MKRQQKIGISVTLNLKDLQEWHKWLESNHDRTSGAWLVIYKKNSKQTGLRYNEALEEALCFGWIDGKMRSLDEDKFVLRFSPRNATSVWSKINRDKAEMLIAQGRMTKSGLAKIEQAQKDGSWDVAEHVYRLGYRCKDRKNT